MGVSCVDVSSKNMLVDRDFSIRVADFGMSRQRRKAMLSAKSQGGTAEWTAPEVLRGLPYHEKADVFSFGVILYEFMTQAEPWHELSTIQVGCTASSWLSICHAKASATQGTTWILLGPWCYRNIMEYGPHSKPLEMSNGLLLGDRRFIFM